MSGLWEYSEGRTLGLQLNRKHLKASSLIQMSTECAHLKPHNMQPETALFSQTAQDKS